MTGLIYDTQENARLQSILNQQNKMLQSVDDSKENSDKKIIKYAIILGGAIVVLALFKLVVSKK